MISKDRLRRLTRGWMPEYARTKNIGGFSGTFRSVGKRPIGICFSLAVISCGLLALLVPYTLMPSGLDVYILTGVELVVDNTVVDPLDWIHAYTLKLTPPHGTGQPDTIYTLVYIAYDKSSTRIINDSAVQVILPISDHSPAITGDVVIGFSTDPIEYGEQVSLITSNLVCQASAEKDGWKQVIWEVQGGDDCLPDNFMLNLETIEDIHGLVRPYKVACSCSYDYCLETLLEQRTGHESHLSWEIVVEHDTVTLTKYADAPTITVMSVNPFLMLLKRLQFVLLLAGAAFLVYTYHVRRKRIENAEDC